jgi:alkaline phosphatase
MKPLSLLAFALSTVLVTGVASPRSETVRYPARAPKHIILFIGDGMGFEHVRAARAYLGAPLPFELFPYKRTVNTSNARGGVTDSAAAATAMATGRKVGNGVVSIAHPGTGEDLMTVLELAKREGKRTGLVTTTEVTNATPAAFGAHVRSRREVEEIARDMLHETRPHVLLGGGGAGMSPPAASAAGYQVVRDREMLLGVDTEQVEFLSGQFGDTHIPYERDGVGALPHLSDMTAVALEILEQDPDGFFLMVEGGRIDQAAHLNKLAHMIGETIEFGKAVETARAWAEGRDDTVILVTADHETGGLTVVGERGKGEFPDVTWRTTDHTGARVPLYAWGALPHVMHDVSSAEIDNTEMYRFTASIHSRRPVAEKYARGE